MYGCTDVRTYVQTDGRTENLPILQDFVPYRGRCPATAQLQLENCIKRGKGTADHMMPLGAWFYFSISPWIPLDGPPDPQIALKTGPADPSTGPPDLPTGPQDPPTGISDPLGHQLGCKYTLGVDIA